MKHTLSYIPSHPHPLFSRKTHFINLNGEWDFSFLKDDISTTDIFSLADGIKKQHNINVPYCYNVQKSGINIEQRHHAVAYQKEFNGLENIDENETYLLHFDSVDYESYIFLNGHYMGHHIGGYTRFSFDIKPFIKKDNKLVVVCIDNDEAYKPRGKQSWMDAPWGCWYKETIGIHKTVWLEKVNQTRIDYVKVSAIKEKDAFSFEYDLIGHYENMDLEIEISLDGHIINKITKPILEKHETVYLDIKNRFTGFKTQYWTVDSPILFDISYRLISQNKIVDEVLSYNGFRFVETHKNKILFNNNPRYLRMILFQGYYKDKGLTGEESDFISVIKTCKEIGLNGIRVHQKIEDELFYYYCDVLGLMAFLEMPSAYEFNNETIKNINKEYLDIINQNSNHTSIIAYVPLNESWGVPHITSDIVEQNFAKSLYFLTKTYDPYRLCIDNDGWEHTDVTDIVTLHNYDQCPTSLKAFYEDTNDIILDNSRVDFKQDRSTFVSGAKYHGQPIMVDEFIGTSFNGKDGWGYGNGVDDVKQYIERIKGLISAIKANKDIAGFCITQFNDTYQETNGLFLEDFEPKVDKDILQNIIK